MKVLVTAASKYGATAEIAEAIGTRLSALGLENVVKSPEEVLSLEGFDAVVLGSGVYAGSWLKAARSFVDQYGDLLNQIQVWLFSSGPIGDPPKPEEDKAVNIEDIISALNPIEHKLFDGKLDKSVLKFADKAIVAAVKAEEGDSRDWDAIAAWAGEIGSVLSC